MPNTHSTLTSLFSDIADSIRAKTGSSDTIIADNFPNAIDAIPTGTPSLGYDITFIVDSQEYLRVSSTPGKKLDEPIPYKAGHEFIGWRVQPNGEGKQITFPYAPTEDLTLYAYFSEPYLEFSSPTSFTLKTYNETKNWDGTVEYSTDHTNWSTWDGTEISSALDNETYELYLRGIGNTYLTANGNRSARFVITGSNVSAIGSLDTVLDYVEAPSSDFKITANSVFENLFYGCTALIKTPELPCRKFYPTSSSYLYQYMFYGCTSLTYPPYLPSLCILHSHYRFMFQSCTSLLETPELPATDLMRPGKPNGSYNCYNGMFAGCTALTKASDLPAKVLSTGAYDSMFSGCTSLVNPPKIEAEYIGGTGATFNRMFASCNSLKNTPALKLKEVKLNCCNNMFSGCGSLESIPELPVTELAQGCYKSMFAYSSVKFSTVQTGAYQTPYRIPSSGTGTDATDALTNMFGYTAGTFKGTPAINTTYYTSNAVVHADGTITPAPTV